MKALARVALLCVALLLLVAAPSASGAPGDKLRELLVPSEFPGSDNFCSIGLGFDGINLYYDRCSDGNLYKMTTFDADADGDAEFVGALPSGIAEFPNAMAFDTKRNGFWIGTQNCNEAGAPIYFYSLVTGLAVEQFTIPFGLINPATGESFIGFCFDDGLAYDENDPTTDADDRLWYSDDVNYNVGKFQTDGTLDTGYDARTVSPELAPTSGLAVGGPLLYLANNGGGKVFRTDKSTNPLAPGAEFATESDRLEDMECDPITFFPNEAIWVRSTPQGDRAEDLVFAFEIEPQTCGLGGQEPEICGDGIDNDGDGQIDEDCPSDRVAQHFRAYRAQGARATGELMTLVDQFGPEEVQLGSIRLLMTPVEKRRQGREPEPIQRPEEHLKCYGITGADQARTVTVSNQFRDETVLRVRAPSHLCAPASKTHEGNPGEPPDDLNHYKCYTVDRTPLIGEEVGLSDQFGPDEMVRVLRLIRLCNPVEKRRQGRDPEPPPHPTEHLACYQVREPTTFVSPTVFTRDQFRDRETVKVTKPSTLCVPSEKTEGGGV
jgi:hypothetical protein